MLIKLIDLAIALIGRKVSDHYRRATLRRRQRKTPCASCHRTLINQKIRTPFQFIYGGWTCAGCGHVHAERRGRQEVGERNLQPAE